MAPVSLEGQKLGKYQILEPLGQGGMARVYRAYHPQLDRYAAVKVMRPDLVGEEEFLNRFRREARAVAALRHPNIVQVFDFDVQDDLYFMVMEILEGDTLKARMNEYRQRGETMPFGEMIKILLDILAGLGYAHDQGMIHRDIKPANIMLSRTGSAVLADFGIVQIVGGTSHTASGALIGTLQYMAPEQGLEGKCDARSDIYSLGVVFYEMLTGKPPYDADTPLAILMKHVNDPLPAPGRINPNIPPALERICLKVLSKHAEDRYQNTTEFAEALRLAAAETGIEIPGAISAPRGNAVPGPVRESVAIYSGKSRPKEEEAGFAVDDTASFNNQSTTMPPVKSSVLEENLHRATEDIHEATEKIKNATGNITGAGSIPNAGVKLAGALVGWNLLAVMISGITGKWLLYSEGFPIIFLVLALGLTFLMESMSLMPMIIPISLFFCLGIVMSFFTVFNAWGAWGLWLLIPMVLFTSIWFFLKRTAAADGGKAAAQKLGKDFQQILFGFIIAIGLLVLINPVR